jgi:phage FluMu gp28-like protein
MVALKFNFTMDKLNYYQNIIKKILTEYADISSQVPDQDIEETLIFDDDRSQYLWFNIGWTNGKRIKAISVYLRLKNDKIYIEEDWTEAGIATELMRLGIPSSEIFLAFQPPEVRQFTEFAIA